MGEGAKTPPQSSLPVTLLQDVLDLPDSEHQPLLVTKLVEANVLQILHTDTQHLIDCSVALKQSIQVTSKFTITSCCTWLRQELKGSVCSSPMKSYFFFFQVTHFLKLS